MNVLPERYNVESFFRACKNPENILNEIRWNLLGRRVCRYNMKRTFGDGFDVMSEDWDNLIILDALRWDIFDSYNTIDGAARPVLSKGSTSAEFLRKNFEGRDLSDTVYVTANPNAEMFDTGVFYTIRKTYGSETAVTGYPPEIVSDIALDAHRNYPNKRLIVHFMQPHTPYLGDTADNLRERVRDKEDVGFDYIQGIQQFDDHKDQPARKVSHLREAAKLGYISHRELMEVYTENFKIVSNHVEDLLPKLDGKSVITSDHGELLGDPDNRLYDFVSPKKYGHSEGVFTPELRLVPWLVVESDDRRDIIPDDPVRIDDVDQDVVEENLEALGYL